MPAEWAVGNASWNYERDDCSLRRSGCDFKPGKQLVSPFPHPHQSVMSEWSSRLERFGRDATAIVSANEHEAPKAISKFNLDLRRVCVMKGVGESFTSNGEYLVMCIGIELAFRSENRRNEGGRITNP